MNIRKSMFKLMKKKSYDDISNNIKKLKNHIDNPIKINNEQLNDFILYSIHNSKYYNNMRINRIEDFPILTKEILKRNYKDIITVDRNKLNQYIKVTTSGSTGTPFQFSITKEKQNNKQAQIIYFGSLSGFDVGIKHAFIRSIKPTVKQKIIKNQYVITPDKMDRKWMEKAIENLKSKNIKVMVGYPSAINNIALIMIESNQKLSNIEGIITSGENLSHEMMENITKAFGVIPYSRYATEELGVIANTFGDGSSFLVNQVDFLVEVLDKENNPVSKGESGAVVVTDFHSHVTPLIRYDTGDIAKVKSYKDGLLHEIEQLEGRKIETIFDVSGNMVSAFSINTIMRTYSDILQFQFIQQDRNIYELKVLPLDLNNHEDYRKAINSFKKLLGEEAKLTLNIVPEIKTLKSGKRPYIINKYKKE